MSLPLGKLKIGLLGVEDPADVRSYSGTPFHLAHFLGRAGHHVSILGPYPLRHRTLVRAHNRLRRVLTRKDVLWERHRLIVDQYPAIVQQYVDRQPDLDLLLATSVFYVAGVKTTVPVAFWADTTVAGLIGQYQRYQSLSARTLRRAHAVEQDALSACDLAIFSNRWAAQLAMASYDLDPAKVRVITYGANLLQVPDQAEMSRLLADRDPEQIELIALGFDWQRKGMTRAIAVTTELRQRGLNARLQIVGCQPPPGFTVPHHVSLLGKISKYSPDGVERLKQVLGASHLLILPTEAECAAVVLAEANAYGVPFISTNVGGNASLVQQGYNGTLLPLHASVVDWADAATRILHGRANYERFCWQAYNYFHQKLSWERAVSEFELAVRELLGTPALSASAV